MPGIQVPQVRKDKQALLYSWLPMMVRMAQWGLKEYRGQQVQAGLLIFGFCRSRLHMVN
jgi:hypothetical protein